MTICPLKPIQSQFSSPYNYEHSPKYCVDNDALNTACRTQRENNPFLVLEYDTPIAISQVTLSRLGTGEKYKVSVSVTDEYPTKGISTTGNYSTFHHSSFEKNHYFTISVLLDLLYLLHVMVPIPF